jgi:iron(III) transport system substrate-binding protein
MTTHKEKPVLSGFVGTVAALLTVLTTSSAFAEGKVNIYSYRQPDLIKPVLDAFTAETGIAAEVLFLDKGLEERIQAEGQNSPADVILSTDVSKLVKAVGSDIVQPIVSETIAANIPANFRDPENRWFGVTMRGRVVYASKDRVTQDAITYEELADPKWKGKICIRSGQHDYNLALFGSLIEHLGAEKAEQWLQGFKANLARKPDGNDRQQAKAIFAGECDIALGNTYYIGLMQTNEKEPEQKDWAAAVKVLFPNAGDRGTHVNISGMVMAKHAPNKDNALKFMEFLSSPKAQEIYAAQVYEYPVNPAVQPSEAVKALGALKPDTLPLAAIAATRKAASEMVDRVGVDDGPGS